MSDKYEVGKKFEWMAYYSWASTCCCIYDIIGRHRRQTCKYFNCHLPCRKIIPIILTSLHSAMVLRKETTYNIPSFHVFVDSTSWDIQKWHTMPKFYSLAINRV